MVLTENEIIHLCQNGDMSQFSYLYEKYVDSVYKFIYLKVYDQQIAEDITSEVFLKSIKKVDTYIPKQDASFKSWILKIAYNSVIDYYRTKKEEPSIDEIQERGYFEDIAGKIDEKQRAKKVHQFLATLDSRERKILVMRFWDELSFKEISEIT